VPGVIPSQVPDFAFPPADLQETPLSPFLQPVEVPLGDSTALGCITQSSQFYVTCRLAEGALCPSTRVTREAASRASPSVDPQGTRRLTGLQLAAVPPVRTLRAWLFSSFQSMSLGTDPTRALLAAL